MDISFRLVDDLVTFMQSFNAPWFVSGGWAIDLHLNRITRDRCDLDISVPHSDRFRAIDFFLEKGWQVEGKLRGGFKTIRKLSDYDEEMDYTWCFLKEADFVKEYLDEGGNRRIAYNRSSQQELDYVEVFFDRIEDGYFVYRREPRIKRVTSLAILKRDGIRYLAPEVVLLFKSNDLSKKNQGDFDNAIPSMEAEAISWLSASLSLLYGDSHGWGKTAKIVNEGGQV